MSKNKANIWGMHAVQAAWQNTRREISQVFLMENAAREFSAFQSVSGARRPAPVMVQRKELDKMTGGGVHQGIAIAAGPMEEVFLSDLIIQGAQSEHSLLLMLDQVTDPHNVGAILRSACAFGAMGVIMQKKHAPNLDGVLAKTACGAVEHVPVVTETNLNRTIESLQDEGWMVIGMDERGEHEISAYKNHEKIVLVMGAEGAGLRPNVAKHCDALAKLEMRGPMPSVNVSNAAAIALYILNK